MAWYKGNAPTSAIADDWGRILCEILFATNERQAHLGVAERTWPTVGNRPATNALDGYEISEIGQDLIDDWKNQMDGMLTTTFGLDIYERWCHKTAYVAITSFTTLHSYAGGTWPTDSSGWGNAAPGTIAVGEQSSKLAVVSDMLKMVEYLTHVKAWTNSDGFDSWTGRYKYWYFGRFGDYGGWPPVADMSPAACRAACEKDTAWAMGFVFWAEDIAWDFNPVAGENVYDEYFIYKAWWKWIVNVPSGTNVETARIAYTTDAANDTAADIKIYEISAAEYAAVNWADPEGTLIHTSPMPATASTAVDEEFDSYGSISTGVNTLYWKMTGDGTAPFADNNTTQSADPSGGLPEIYLVHSKTSGWTYN